MLQVPETPCLVVDVAKVRENVRRMQQPVDHGHLPVGDQGLQAIQSPAPHRLLRLTAEDK